MEKEWKNVQTNGRGQEYVKARELSGGIRSSCRAIFFRNTHETTGEKIVSLKIARLNKSNGLLTEKQNKSVTLNSDELDKLIEYIQDYYAPLNIGMKEFISVDEDAAKLFSKIRSLNISDDEVVDKLISTGILTDNLSVAITAAERKMAITEFENAIALEKSESYWQTWFEKNKFLPPHIGGAGSYRKS